MIVPDSTSRALSWAKSLSPPRDFTSPGPSHFVRPADSVYRERTSCPSALMRTIPRAVFGPSGTRSYAVASSLTAQRRTSRASILPDKHACLRAHTPWPSFIRPIWNTQPQTRRFTIRSIGNITLRLAKDPFRSIGNIVLETADILFGIPGTRRAMPLWLSLFEYSLPIHHDIAYGGPSKKDPELQTRRLDFRSIRNDERQNPEKPFRSIRTIARKPSEFLYGLSRTASAYRERRLGRSGTNRRPIRNGSSVYQEHPPAGKLRSPLLSRS